MRTRIPLAIVLVSALAAPAALAQPKPESLPKTDAKVEPKPDAAKVEPKPDPAKLEAQKAEAARVAARLAELVKRGAEACERGELEPGLATLSSAYSQKPDPDTAVALGSCEAKAKHWAAAAEHLAAALRVKEDGPERKRVEELFLDVRKRVGALKLTVDVEGADVFVQNRYVGQTPLPGEAFVDADVDALVVVKKTGFDEAERVVKVGAQRSASLTVALAAASSSGNRYAIKDRTKVPFFVLGGAALIAGGVGAALYASAFSRAADANNLLTELQGGNASATPCSLSANAAACRALGGMRSSRDSAMNIGTGFLIGGGALLGAAVLTGVWAFTSPNPTRTGLSVAPGVARDGASVVLTGAF
jgi:hypothetical protein